MSRATVQIYLFFAGDCEEALNFYRDKLGATVDYIMRYKESPESPPPGTVPHNYGDKIMHASFRVNDTQLMASDGTDPGSKQSGFALSLNCATEADAERAFAALAEGGNVHMPLERTFWSPKFGMLTDRFGVMWMVTLADES